MNLSRYRACEHDILILFPIYDFSGAPAPDSFRLHTQRSSGTIRGTMILFLLFGVPVFCLFGAVLNWDRDLTPPWIAMVSAFLWGVLCFFPGYLIALVVDRMAGSPLWGFPLYLSLLFRRALAPLLLGAGGFMLVQRKLSFPSTREGIFLASFCFLSGFFSLFGAVDFLAFYGNWDALDLFLLPLLRMAMIVICSLAAPAFFRWQGREAAAFAGVCAAVCAPVAFMMWLYEINYRWLSIALVSLSFLGSLWALVWQFPRAFMNPVSKDPGRAR
jgi:hypothetical protein